MENYNLSINQEINTSSQSSNVKNVRDEDNQENVLMHSLMSEKNNNEVNNPVHNQFKNSKPNAKTFSKKQVLKKKSNKNTGTSKGVTGKGSQKALQVGGKKMASGVVKASAQGSKIVKIQNAIKVISKYAKSISAHDNKVSVVLGKDMPASLRNVRMDMSVKNGVYHINFSGFQNIAQQLSAQKWVVMNSSELQSALNNIPNTVGIEININKANVLKAKNFTANIAAKNKKKREEEGGNNSSLDESDKSIVTKQAKKGE